MEVGAEERGIQAKASPNSSYNAVDPTKQLFRELAGTSTPGRALPAQQRSTKEARSALDDLSNSFSDWRQEAQSLRSQMERMDTFQRLVSESEAGARKELKRLEEIEEQLQSVSAETIQVRFDKAGIERRILEIDTRIKDLQASQPNIRNRSVNASLASNLFLSFCCVLLISWLYISATNSP